MSNWFENNPTKSVVAHTLLVGAATWAAFFFIFDENKVKLHEAKASKVEAESKEVNARNSVLTSRIEYLTQENEKLLRWLENTPGSIPYYEKTISELKEKIDTLEQGVIITKPNDEIEPILNLPELYSESGKKKTGHSFIDPKTNTVLGISKIEYDKTAKINLSLPNGEIIKENNASPGQTWDFEQNGKNYRIILESLDWAEQSFVTKILELPNGNKSNP